MAATTRATNQSSIDWRPFCRCWQHEVSAVFVVVAVVVCVVAVSRSTCWGAENMVASGDCDFLFLLLLWSSLNLWLSCWIRCRNASGVTRHVNDDISNRASTLKLQASAKSSLDVLPARATTTTTTSLTTSYDSFVCQSLFPPSRNSPAFFHYLKMQVQCSHPAIIGNLCCPLYVLQWFESAPYLLLLLSLFMSFDSAFLSKVVVAVNTQILWKAKNVKKRPKASSLINWYYNQHLQQSPSGNATTLIIAGICRCCCCSRSLRKRRWSRATKARRLGGFKYSTSPAKLSFSASGSLPKLRPFWARASGLISKLIY